MSKTLQEHLEKVKSRWLVEHTQWGRDDDDNSVGTGSYFTVDYDALVAEIDAFSQTFQTELTDEERRLLGEHHSAITQWCAQCHTYGHDHKKECPNAGTGMTRHVPFPWFTPWRQE